MQALAVTNRGWMRCAGITLAASIPALALVERLWAAERLPLEAPTSGTADNPAVNAPLSLKVRRLPDAVELVVVGTGPAPQLQQAQKGAVWQGVLTTAQSKGVFLGSKRFSLPEAGIQSIVLDGGGTSFRLDLTPLPGVSLARPVVSADGQNLILTFPSTSQLIGQAARPSLNNPGTVPQPTYAPALQPRAVAPPLGDMAVGSMLLRNSSFVNVSGPKVTMTLRNAPVKDVLMAIAQLGSYGFVFVDDSPSLGTASSPANSSSGVQTASSSTSAMAGNEDSGRKVTIAFRNESYARALNSVLLAAGFQGKKEGNLILAGPSVLGKSFGPQMSKVYRLNQASAASAADYLASLGASISKVTIITATSSSSDTAGTASSSASNTSGTTTKLSTVDTYAATSGPLKGLSGTTDSRLQTITLVGDPALVLVAESYLKQLDLRQRQVALNVKILDVSLSSDNSINNSFAFRTGNTFIVSDNGKLSGFFGSYVPPGVSPNGVATPSRSNPGLDYPANQLFDFLAAQITSSNTKVLANPTLILSENPEAVRGGQEVSTSAGSALGTSSIGRPFANESFVTVGTQVITDYTVTAGQNGAGNSCQPQFSTSGLTFGARVSKIDDNGFVTFSLSPSVSATTGTLPIQGCGPVSILSVRRLDTGTVRVRDGQTLILTGVISSEDAQVVTKWPILGDIPLVGQFFRSSGGKRRKSELVILVTPRIVDDTQGGSFGYGYRPPGFDSQVMAPPAI